MRNPYLKSYLNNNLRSCQLKQVRILEEIVRICDKYNIEYWLDGGSLLGAVRHGGFIPWDDDIDIAMSLSDLKRFIKVAPSELPENLFLQTKHSDPAHRDPIIKVRDLNSLYIESGDTFNVEYQKGLFVDIFPFVDYPNLPRKWVKKLCKGMSKSYSILHKQHYYSLRSFAEFFFFTGKYYLYRLIWETLSLFVPKSVYMGNVLHNNGYGIMHRKDSVYPLSEVVFEGKKFKAPGNMDAYLKDLYKNYMEIPPVEKRQVHAVYIQTELVKIN